MMILQLTTTDPKSKQPAKLLLAGLLALATLGGSASACNPRPRPAGPTIRRIPPANSPTPQFQPPPQFRPAPNGVTANDVIINDLPAEAKRAIRAAAKSRTNTTSRQPSQRQWATP